MTLSGPSRSMLRLSARPLAAAAVRPQLLRYPRGRCQSTTSTTPKSPSSKIAAIPFHFSKEEAEPWLKIGALNSAPSIPNFIYALFLRYFGEKYSWLLREFGLAAEGMTHLQTRAVLYPVWRYSLVLKSKVRPTEGTLKEHSGWMMLDGNGLAGNAFSPLSLLCIGAKNDDPELETYDPATHLSQLGSEPIAAVPFTVQPWTVWQHLKDRLGESLRWDELDAVINVKEDVKEALMALYPVYVPIYIAEYAHKVEGERGQGRRITVVMDASTDIEDTRIMFPRPAMMRHTGTASYWWNNTYPFRFFALHTPHQIGGDPDASVDRFLIKATALFDPPHVPQVVNGRPVEDAPGDERVPPDSVVLEGDVGESALDWSDGRILHWSGEERQQNIEWMGAINTLEEKKALFEHITGARKTSRRQGRELELVLPSDTDRGRPMTKMTLTEAKRRLTNGLRDSEDEVRAKKPRWLTEWEAGVAQRAKEARRSQQQGKK